jgi:uncharacterized protein YbjT (DUF2867 family)
VGLTRHPASANLPTEVRVLRGSTDDRDAMSAALDDVDAVLLNVFGDIAPTVDAIRAAGTKRVVLVSSITASTRPDLEHAAAFRSVEDAVRGRVPQVTVLRPGQFMSNALWWRSDMADGVIRTPFPDVAVPPVAPEDIAAVAVAATEQDEHHGRTLHVTGPEVLSDRDRAAVLSEVLGIDLRVERVSETDFRRQVPGRPSELLDYMIAVTGHPLETELVTTNVVQELTGTAPMQFREWVRRHAGALSPVRA